MDTRGQGSEHPDRREIACDILRYLSKNPAAKDTLEGIARWWLDRQRVEETVDQVAKALRLLVSSGLIIERQGGSRQIYYRVNLARWADIARFIETDETASSHRIL